VARRRFGLEARVATPSLVSPFLCQNGFKATHLALKKGFHLIPLSFHLRHHLSLQTLDLSCVLLVVFVHNTFKGLLSGGKVLQLMFKSLDTLILFICFHLLGRQPIQQGLFKSILHFLQLSGDIRTMDNWDRPDSLGPGIFQQPRVSSGCGAAQLNRALGSYHRTGLGQARGGRLTTRHHDLTMLHVPNRLWGLDNGLDQPHDTTGNCPRRLQGSSLPIPRGENFPEHLSVTAKRPWAAVPIQPLSWGQKLPFRLDLLENTLVVLCKDPHTKTST
jgi:hypothetical protein